MSLNDKEIEQEIQDKDLTAPRITPQALQDNIAHCHYFTAYEGALMGCDPVKFREAQKFGGDPEGISTNLRLLTFCVLVLKNGFTVSGESACASPENFDEEIGRKIARQNAEQKIWPLMGYELKERLHQ